MNKKNITPNPQQPVDRVPTGQLPIALAELEEASLVSNLALPQNTYIDHCRCSYDGEDE